MIGLEIIQFSLNYGWFPGFCHFIQVFLVMIQFQPPGYNTMDTYFKLCSFREVLVFNPYGVSANGLSLRQEICWADYTNYTGTKRGDLWHLLWQDRLEQGP